jgi:hypothetical protein
MLLSNTFMTAMDLQAIEQHCHQTSSLLDSVEKPALGWAVFQEKLLGTYQNLMRRKRELLEKFPERWQGLAAGEAAASQLFIYPARIRRLLRSSAGEFSEEQTALLQRFAQTPWFYCLFDIRVRHGGAFYTIHDLEQDTERLLFSPGVRDLERTGVRLFLCLLFDNGECLQSFGLVHYYRGFQPYDFRYFAKLLQPDTYRASGLAATIAANPGSFYLLDSSTEVPLFAHQGEPIEVCDHELRLESFDAGKLAGEELELSSAGAVLRLRLKGKDSPLRTGCIFFDPKKKKLLVHATNMKLYARLRELLAPAVRIPAEPEWHASINMNLACLQILGKEASSSGYVGLFDRREHPEPSPEESARLDKLNAFIRDLTDHFNTGREYSLEALAGKHGLEVEAARQVEQSFRKSDAANELQIEGGLREYNPPPPSVRREFKVSPWQNSVFLFLDSPRVRELYASIQPSLCVPFAERQAVGAPVEPPPPSLDELPGWLEDLYSNNTQEQDFTLLNSVLHLLLCRGEVFEPVRDYAVEVLRQFWRLFAPDKEPQQIERFSRRFGRFCYEVIHLSGLADIEPAISAAQAHKANFRPSAFLRAWAKLRPQKTRM